MDQGDPVKIIEGKYSGCSGLVVKALEESLTLPLVRIDGTHEE